jgi:hypothetical protein
VDHHNGAFVGIDTSKLRNAIAVAEEGRGGDVRFLGECTAANGVHDSLSAYSITPSARATGYRSAHAFGCGPQNRRRNSRCERDSTLAE